MTINYIYVAMHVTTDGLENILQCKHNGCWHFAIGDSPEDALRMWKISDEIFGGEPHKIRLVKFVRDKECGELNELLYKAQTE